MNPNQFKIVRDSKNKVYLLIGVDGSVYKCENLENAMTMAHLHQKRYEDNPPFVHKETEEEKRQRVKNERKSKIKEIFEVYEMD